MPYIFGRSGKKKHPVVSRVKCQATEAVVEFRFYRPNPTKVAPIGDSQFNTLTKLEVCVF